MKVSTWAAGAVVSAMLAAGCNGAEELATESGAETPTLASTTAALAGDPICPAGSYDMLDWMTLDADLRGSNRLVGDVHPLYTLVESDRFWWMKTAQGDTWDLNTFDADYIYFAATEQSWHSPWTCKPAVDVSQWKAARRCAKPGDASATIVNASSKFQVLSSNEVQHSSGDQGTVFDVRDAGVMDWGALGSLPTLMLDYQWNCWDGTCHRLERFFLAQRYGQVRWEYYEEGVLAGHNQMLKLEPAAVPAKMFSCTTPPQYKQASLSSNGAATSGSSSRPSIDDTGRFIAYESVADNLVIGDTNGVADIFVYDGYWGATLLRASVATGGGQANGPSSAAAISRQGAARYIAFQSDASNLVANDTNSATDVFVHDRWTGTTTLVSVGSGGPGNAASRAPSISADGCKIAFESEATNLVPNDTNGPGVFGTDIFVRDRCVGTTKRVSVTSTGAQVMHVSRSPSIDDAGRFVVFESGGSDLVPGDTNGIQDVFVYDGFWGVTIARASVSSAGVQANDQSNAPKISGDGRYVAFMSRASNLVGGDTNGRFDVFTYDRWTGLTTSATVGTAVNGDAFYPQISADGRFLAFTAPAPLSSGGWISYLHDRFTGDSVTPRALDGSIPINAWVGGAAISTGGRAVAGLAVPNRITLAFESTATNVVAGPDNAGGIDIFTRTVTVP